MKCANGFIQYKGGRTECIVISENISHANFVSKLCGELNIDPKSIKLYFMMKFNPSCLLPLYDDVVILKMFKFNDMFCRVYIFTCIEVSTTLIAPTRHIWA